VLVEVWLLLLPLLLLAWDWDTAVKLHVPACMQYIVHAVGVEWPNGTICCEHGGQACPAHLHFLQLLAVRMPRSSARG
jgi:hypothetical protein